MSQARAIEPMLGRRAAAGVLAGLCLALPACTSTPAAPTSSAPAVTGSPDTAGTPAGSASASPSGSEANTVAIDITIANGQVTPSGQKLDLTRGQKVILNVTSDQDDEIHAHTAGDGYELEVTAGKPATGSFVVTDSGSFEIESHHLDKIIAILNVR